MFSIMALRTCTTKAAQIETVVTQLRKQLEALKSRGTLVKNTSEYKKQLLVRNICYWKPPLNDLTKLKAEAGC